jgi:polyisoprenyl-teichoic acid--peptidoglycan teichoic acid transferase
VNSERVPRPGRGVLVRALLAAVLILSLSATAVAYAVLTEVDSLVKDFTGGKEGRTVVKVREIDPVDAGKPRTFLILGTDERYADKKAGVKPRSDTILLARADPKTKRIALMSLPRDLKVEIPGAGTNKINVAYEIGGPDKTVSTIKRLFRDATDENFPINHVIAVSFGGFRRAVDYIGGAYVDIDRRYYNDNTTAAAGENYATIDVQPGYQKLKGQDALDYVRYRHGDNDFFRAARQQDFLRQLTHQDAIRQLLDVSKRHELAKIFGRYFEVDDSFTKASNLIALGQLGLYMAQEKAPVNEVRFPATEAKNPAVDSYLYVKDADLKKTFAEFMTGEGSSNPRRLDETTRPKATSTPARAKKKNKQSSVEGLEQARTEGENMAVIVASENKLKFPFYFPSLRKTGSRYADPEPRVYSIRDGQDKLHRAYRLTLNAGSWSEYYGIQGTTGRDPPILDDPDRVREVDGRKLELFYDGSHLRRVAWRTSKASYWVTNTLTLSIPNSRLIAIASSLRRLK